MIRAIIFDCFGVLASDGWLPFKEKYFGGNKELYEKVTKLNQDIDGGLSSFDNFIRKVSELAGISEGSARGQIENNIPDEKLFEYISKELRPKYKLGMLSNAAANWLDVIFLPEQVKLFDAIALSYDIGVIKPNKEAYQIISDRLNTPINECLFIDDQERYCEGALLAGMKAIHYTSCSQLKEEVKKYLDTN
jgi:putative hydrolase of the HAD superfamily